MSVQSFAVTGLTCEHCVRAVQDELGALPGVSEVTVELVPTGRSIIQVAGSRPLSDTQLADALDEAGDYRLAEHTNGAG